MIEFWLPWGAGFFSGLVFGVTVTLSEHPELTFLGNVVGFALGWFVIGRVLRRMR